MRLLHEDEIRAVIRERLEPEMKPGLEDLDAAVGILTSGRPIQLDNGPDYFVVI